MHLCAQLTRRKEDTHEKTTEAPNMWSDIPLALASLPDLSQRRSKRSLSCLDSNSLFVWANNCAFWHTIARTISLSQHSPGAHKDISILATYACMELPLLNLQLLTQILPFHFLQSLWSDQLSKRNLQMKWKSFQQP